MERKPELSYIPYGPLPPPPPPLSVCLHVLLSSTRKELCSITSCRKDTADIKP